jgi:hypothetical protein
MKFRVEHHAQTVTSVQGGVQRYSAFLKEIHGTDNGKAFKIYDHVAKILLGEVLTELMECIDGDLDRYCEKVIFEEF